MKEQNYSKYFRELSLLEGFAIAFAQGRPRNSLSLSLIMWPNDEKTTSESSGASLLTFPFDILSKATKDKPRELRSLPAYVSF